MTQPKLIVRNLFTIYIAQSLHPVILAVDEKVDLIAQWLDGIKEREKKLNWWQPIEFRDVDGTIVILLATSAIAGIMRGGTQEQPLVDAPLPKRPNVP